MEECCLICAEPLEWVAFGPCGHKEACSKCVMRMRFVLKNDRCVMCQQESSAVYVTRSMGTFTAPLPPEEFKKLSFKDCREKGLHCLKSCNAFFDDEDHFHHIRKLCSFTHKSLERANGRQQTFPSLRELKKHMGTTFSLHFCDICLGNRKVFVAEQEVYSKAQLDKHNRQGDDTGPLAESGFSGHPQCKFCKQRFYGDNEIFQHMQTAHEHCFLCRRSNPDKYVYYKDYAELEGHFRSDHHICEHQECLANRFVVFSAEAELKQHMAMEHKENMSKGQRREALTLPTAFQYDRGADPTAGGSSGRAPAIVIGGGAGLNQRSSGGRGHSAQSSVSAHEQQMVAAMHASMQTAQAELARFDSEQDFPQALGGGGSSAGAGSSGRWAAATSSAGGGRSMTEEDFPALPGMSKSARRRANQKANQQQQQQQQQRGRGGGSAGPSSAFPHSASAPNLQQQQQQQQQQRAAPAPAPVPAPVPVPRQPQWAGGAAPGGAASAPAPSGRPAAEEWPQMAAAPRPAAVPPPAGNLPTTVPRWAAAATGTPQSLQSTGGAPAPYTMPQAPPTDDPDAFPSLPPSSGPSLRRSGRAQQQRQQKPKSSASSSSSPTKAQPSSSSSSSSNVSEAMREANRLLIDKIRQRVDDGSFAKFKAESGSFMRHQIGAQAYFDQIRGLGLLSLTPELAALCPEPLRRAELLEAFRSYSTSAPPSSSAADWTPPEVVEAALQENSLGSWECSSCSLLNGPQAHGCEGCGSEREAVVLRRDPDEEQTSPPANGGKKGKKGKKQSKFERLRIGEDGGTSSSSSSSRATHPQNAWTQEQQGSWGGGGGSRLAQSIAGVNDAWGGRRY